MIFPSNIWMLLACIFYDFSSPTTINIVISVIADWRQLSDSVISPQFEDTFIRTDIGEKQRARKLLSVQNYFKNESVQFPQQLEFKLQSHWTTRLQYLQEGSHLQGNESTGHWGFIASPFIGAICWQMLKEEVQAICDNKNLMKIISPKYCPGEKQRHNP